MKKFNITILTILLFGGLTSAVSAAGGLAVTTSEIGLVEAPINLSFSVSPLQKRQAEVGEFEVGTLPAASLSSGLSFKTNLEAGSLHGALTYFKGDSEAAAGVDWYSAYSVGNGASFTPVFTVTDRFNNPYSSFDISSTNDEKLKKLEGLALHAGFEVNRNLELSGALSISKAEKEAIDEGLNSYTATSYDWQIDLGGAYKFKENMTYSVNFGYWNVGDPQSSYVPQSSTSLQQGSVYILNQKLNMSF